MIKTRVIKLEKAKPQISLADRLAAARQNPPPLPDRAN
jgi:hypothetical protein